MGSTPEAPPADTFAGYELGDISGDGIAGRLFAARHLESGLDVAIEVIDPPLAADSAFRARLWTEVDRAAALEHPSIAAVYEALAHDGRVGVVTDPLSSGKAANPRRGEDGLPLAAALYIAEAVLLALVAAHRAGVIHGAIEPRTIGVEGTSVRVGGFGVGRALHPEVTAEPATDTRAVARFVVDLTAGPAAATYASLPRQLRVVLAHAASSRRDRQYRNAAAMRSALADAARHDLGRDWRETAAAQLLAISGASPSAAAPPPDSKSQSESESQRGPHAGTQTSRLAPIIRADRSDLVQRRATPGRALRKRVAAAAVVGLALLVGVGGGLLASAMRGSTPAPAGSLSVGQQVSVQVRPVQGWCNSAFVATARGPVQGSGTLVYRWERSDGEQTANTQLSVRPSEGSFLITEHWQAGGQVSHPAITFRLVSPVAMAVTRSLPYSCP